MRYFLRDRYFWQATALLVGTMVGAGIYGIPFAFAKAGFLLGAAWLVALTLAVGLFNLLFAELTLSTEGVHQVSGYAHIWTGGWGRRVVTFANVLGIYGALLAYLILFGEFAHNILSQFIAVDPQLYSYLFAGAWSLFWLARIRTLAGLDLIMAGLYGLTVAGIVALGLPKIEFANFAGIEPHFWHLPYGVVLFSLGGVTAIPLQRQLLTGRERLLRPAIIAAMLFVAVLYLVFAFAVVGVSGEVTSPSAITGLFDFLGTPIVILGSVLGLLTISTSFLTLGTALFETFSLDYRMRTAAAWLLAALPPVIFFWSGLRNFIDVIGLVGSVSMGIMAVVLLLACLRSRRTRLRTPEFRVRVPAVVVWLLMLVFLVGAGYELFLRWSV